MNMLGDTLEKIAFEKAGIIKQGVPVVIGEKHPATTAVFRERAESLKAPLTFADQQRYVADWKFEKNELVAEVTSSKDQEKEFYRLDLTGIYQLKNLLTMLEAVHGLELKGWNLGASAVHKGLKTVRKSTGLHGRWEVIHENPTVILDVAHNEDGIRQIVSQFEITDHEDLHIVIGMVRDKETYRILSLLPRQAAYYFTKAWIPRALPEDQLAEMGGAVGLKGHVYENVNVALETAMENAGPRDLIIVCGSVFLVGELNTRLAKRGQEH
jgi:dihydrofolate synthase/folylpolyglutamate synthase